MGAHWPSFAGPLPPGAARKTAPEAVCVPPEVSTVPAPPFASAAAAAAFIADCTGAESGDSVKGRGKRVAGVAASPA